MDTIDWQTFDDAPDSNNGGLPDSVTRYITKCIDDFAPQTTICTYPNQKPWIYSEIHTKLNAWTSAFNSGDPDTYKAARYDLRNYIRNAKRDYRDKVDCNSPSSDPKRTFIGLHCIIDYKRKQSVPSSPHHSQMTSTTSMLVSM